MNKKEEVKKKRKKKGDKRRIWHRLIKANKSYKLIWVIMLTLAGFLPALRKVNWDVSK